MATANQIVERLLEIQRNNQADISGLNIEAKMYGLVVKENFDLILMALRTLDVVVEEKSNNIGGG